MRCAASEKMEIIRLVERSHLPVKRTLDKLGFPRATFYRWCDRYQTGGPQALEGRSPSSRQQLRYQCPPAFRSRRTPANQRSITNQAKEARQPFSQPPLAHQSLTTAYAEMIRAMTLTQPSGKTVGSCGRKGSTCLATQRVSSVGGRSGKPGSRASPESNHGLAGWQNPD